MCDAHMRAMRVTHSLQYTHRIGGDCLVNGGIPEHILHVYFNLNAEFAELGERAASINPCFYVSLP